METAPVGRIEGNRATAADRQHRMRRPREHNGGSAINIFGEGSRTRGRRSFLDRRAISLWMRLNFAAEQGSAPAC